MRGAAIFGLVLLTAMCASFGCGDDSDDDSSASGSGTGGAGVQGGSGGTDTAGTGGGLVTGGTVGTGGSIETPETARIDNFEDADDRILPYRGRQGGWGPTHDGTGEQSPDPLVPVGSGEGHDSDYALRISGTGFQVFGGVAASLNYSEGFQPYDASAYSGVTFWAKGDPARVTLYLTTVDTALESEGGNCTVGCSDHFSADFDLTADWQQHSFTWDQLAQYGSGTPVTFDPASLLVLGFMIWSDSFDMYLDDVSFMI